MGADEFRQFAREERLRFERFLREFRADSIRSHEKAMREADVRHAEAMRRLDVIEERMREEHAELRDLREEGRAQRQALLAILDRLNGGGAATAT